MLSSNCSTILEQCQIIKSIFRQKDSSYQNSEIKKDVILDTIEDAQIAIEWYNSNIIKEYDNIYLALYGLFQALIIQQDAIDELFTVLDKERDNPCRKNSLLCSIRKIRNDTVGHPSKRNASCFCRILRSDLSQFQFTYILYSNERTEQNIVDVHKAINDQEYIIFNLLMEVIKIIDDLSN